MNPSLANPHRYHQDCIDIILANSTVTMDQQPKGSLFMERASDSQISFFTQLQLPTQDGTKLMMVKIVPGAQVNTIPLSRFCTLFPNKCNKSRYTKANALLLTAHTWLSHSGSPKPFLGHFVADVQHVSEPRMYPTHFYVFKDPTSPQILLSYMTSERLGIIVFKVPNLAASSQVDS